MPIDPKTVKWDDEGVVWDDAKPPSWKDLPRNIIPSAGRFVGGLADAVTNPLRTIGGVMDIAAGGLRNITPEPIRRVVDSVDTVPGSALTDPEAGPRASAAANAVGQFYKDRYGSLEGAKRTAIEDPVGLAADVSSVLGLGAGTARLAGAPGVSKALMTASNATNPLSAVGPGLRLAGKAVGGIGKHVLGMTTGVGAENISQAFKAGKAGDKAFLGNLTGTESMNDVLLRAKSALQTMREAKSAEYAKGIADTAADTTPLKFDAIDKALSETIGSLKYANKWKVGKDQLGKVQELEKVVREWRIANPDTYHTAMGLDALKKRLDALYPESQVHSQAQRAITSVRNAVKDTIVEQSPSYAKTMADYEQAINIEREIERALSLGTKSAQDTALRKLQSLSRNNANTNYGNRLDLAQVLEQQGGQSILPSIAGQAMNSWTPRSLSGQMGGLGTMLAAAQNPALAAALPFMSPKAVGASAYGLGRASGGARGLLGPAALDRLKLAGLLGSQEDRLLEEGR